MEARLLVAGHSRLSTLVQAAAENQTLTCPHMAAEVAENQTLTCPQMAEMYPFLPTESVAAENQTCPHMAAEKHVTAFRYAQIGLPMADLQPPP